jgi:hypothetical protein
VGREGSLDSPLWTMEQVDRVPPCELQGQAVGQEEAYGSGQVAHSSTCSPDKYL